MRNALEEETAMLPGTIMNVAFTMTISAGEAVARAYTLETRPITRATRKTARWSCTWAKGPFMSATAPPAERTMAGLLCVMVVVGVNHKGMGIGCVSLCVCVCCFGIDSDGPSVVFVGRPPQSPVSAYTYHCAGAACMRMA